MPPRQPDQPPPEVTGQTRMFDAGEVALTLTKQSVYYCIKCGSQTLLGIQPTTDEKDRWAIAARCLGCGRRNVVAMRG